MKVIAIDDLPADPLAAASVFDQHWLPYAEEALDAGDDVTLAFAPADHTHRMWRLAMVAGLARKYAPRRINGVAGEGEAIDAAAGYLAAAPGVTGQYLSLDSQAAGNPAQ
ncbi:Rossmann fold domain-containing protein [Pelagerythrobacter sp.]|uniref:Rossmann fold domain-containing protein n=1 Tax=Pelagerythrobacter sp. TaxID=2800702 RepID=UPI0035B178F0